MLLIEHSTRRIVLQKTQLDIIAAHRRFSSTYCCSQKTQLDILLLTEDSARHTAAHRRPISTYCCSQKTQIDILLLTEDPFRHIAAHRRLRSTYCFLTEDCSILRLHCAVVNSRGTPGKLESAYRTFAWCHQKEEKRRTNRVESVSDCVPICEQQRPLIESMPFYNYWDPCFPWRVNILCCYIFTVVSAVFSFLHPPPRLSLQDSPAHLSGSVFAHLCLSQVNSARGSWRVARLIDRCTDY